MIKIEAVWLAAEPRYMRFGMESALARAVKVFGGAWPYHAYVFANRRANRMKALVHDGIGVWLTARRLNLGNFVWPRELLRHWHKPSVILIEKWSCRSIPPFPPRPTGLGVAPLPCYLY